MGHAATMGSKTNACLAGVLALAGGAACSPRAVVDVGIGPYDYTVDSAQWMIPPELQSAMLSVPRIPCNADPDCPQLGASFPAIHCVSNACTPDPFAVVIPSPVFDLNDNAQVRQYGDHFTSIQVTTTYYHITPRDFRISVGPTDVYWGPEAATGLDSEGVTHFGTIPVVTLDGSTVVDGEIAIDADGSTALSNYLVNTSRRVKLFVQPRITLAPGTMLPTGSVVLQAALIVRVEGQLVR